MDEESFKTDQNGMVVLVTFEVPILADSSARLYTQAAASMSSAINNYYAADDALSQFHTVTNGDFLDIKELYDAETDSLIKVIMACVSIADNHGIDIQQAIYERVL